MYINTTVHDRVLYAPLKVIQKHPQLHHTTQSLTTFSTLYYKFSFYLFYLLFKNFTYQDNIYTVPPTFSYISPSMYPPLSFKIIHWALQSVINYFPHLASCR